LEDLVAKLQADEATRRKEWEEQSQPRALLDMVLNHAPIVLWAVDAAGKFMRSLGGGLSTLGLRPGQLTGKDVFEVYRDCPQFLQSVRRALAGEEFSETLSVGELLFDCRYVPRRNLEDDVVAVWGVAVLVNERELSQRLADVEVRLQQARVDVEQVNRLLQEERLSRLEAAEELDKAQRRRIEFEQLAQITSLGQMAAIMAHKINNPLAAIANYAQGCIRRLRAAKAASTDLGQIEPGLVEALEEVTEQANRASSCIRRLRTVLQQRETTYDRVDPTSIVRSAVEMTEAVARAQGVEIRVEAEPRLPVVMADVLQIEQVLMQLLLNAVDATVSREAAVPPREVVVRARAGERGTVVFSVTDQGPGLSDALREQVFEPFFTTKSKSVGMGLAVSRSVVEAHGGRLWIGEADAGGAAGAVFYFTLPGRAEGSRA
jgi:signal transduction histidine kinase